MKTASLIFLLSLSILLYKMPEDLFFGHEQGRDAAAIKNIYDKHDLTLIGTKTEIEGFFSPPWYYYLMTVPYGLSGDDPRTAYLAIALLTSTTPVIIFFFARELLKSAQWGIAAALVTAASWEIISYGRWLSNVTPAFPFIALAHWQIFKYHQTAKAKFFLLFFAFAILASQFQITLILQFTFVIFALLALRLIKLPSLKVILICLGAALLAFSPLIIFDFRHQHLISKGVLAYVSSSSTFSLNIDPLGTILRSKTSLLLWERELLTVVNRSLFTLKNQPLQIIFYLLLIAGLVTQLKSRINRNTLLFVGILAMMSLAILPFNIGLTQLYQGTAIGWILLLSLSTHSLWQNPKTKVAAFVLFLLLLVGWFKNFQNLAKNNEFFFKPEQDVLSYKDQKALIDFMHNDTEIRPYRFESFTVPYLHSEGWQYLHQFFYPREESKHSKLVYIAIEKGVEPFWEEKWIEDLGRTDLIFEKNFGQVRLQKRLIR